jgi:transcription-repair coupling factor (superfamily II helicase)
MAVLGSLVEIDEMATELADRFGPIPDPVDNLLYQLRIKVIARNAGVPSVTTESGQVQIKLPEGNGIDRLGLQRFMKMDVRVSRKGIWLGRELTTREWQVALVQALERLRELKGRNMLPGSIS